MAKVRNLTQIEKTLAFTEYDFYELYQKAFETHELGRIKRFLPLREMAEKMGLIGTTILRGGVSLTHIREGLILNRMLVFF